MVLFGFRGRSASPPKRCLGSLFCFVLPAIEQIRSNAVAPARLRHIPALDAFLDDLPLLFRGSIYAWFPAHVASCLEALNHTESGSPVLAGSTTHCVRVVCFSFHDNDPRYSNQFYIFG